MRRDRSSGRSPLPAGQNLKGRCMSHLSNSPISAMLRIISALAGVVSTFAGSVSADATALVSSEPGPVVDVDVIMPAGIGDHATFPAGQSSHGASAIARVEVHRSTAGVIARQAAAGDDGAAPEGRTDLDSAVGHAAQLRSDIGWQAGLSLDGCGQQYAGREKQSDHGSFLRWWVSGRWVGSRELAHPDGTGRPSDRGLSVAGPMVVC